MNSVLAESKREYKKTTRIVTRFPLNNLFRHGFFDILIGDQPSNGHDAKNDSRK
jgi:hypothetical protein